MKVETKKVKEIFPPVNHKQISDFLLPFGVYDENNEEDQILQHLVPEYNPEFKFTAKILFTFILALQHMHNILLWGPTGIGKSMIPIMLAAKLNLPLTRINCHGDMTSVDLLGFYHVHEYKHSALVKGIQRPGIIVIDEWDALRPELSIACQRVLEDDEPGIFLPELDTFYRKHPQCIIVATANTSGLGDVTGLYAGTTMQNFASQNRFHLVLKVDPLSPKQLGDIMKKRTINGKKPSAEVVKNMVGFYTKILNAYETNSISTIISVRTMLHFLFYHTILQDLAFEMVVEEKFPTENDKQVARELAERYNLAPVSKT